MKYLIIVQLTFAITCNGVSQISEDLLRTYKNQDLQIRQLNLNGSLNGGNSNSDFLYQFNGGANYSQFINRGNLQSDFSTSLNLNQSKSRATYLTGEPLGSYTSAYLNAAKRSWRYLHNEFFMGLGYRLNYNFNHSTLDHFEGSDMTQKTTGHKMEIAIPLSIGIGRKYPINSVHRSMWIYKELEKNNSLKRTATTQESEQLANLIDQNLYTRYFDSRYKSIDDMKRIDSLLQSQDIINSQNITYFTTLYDMYYYSSGSNRTRGSTFEGGIIGDFYYNHYNFNSSDTLSPGYTEDYRAIVPTLFAEYQYFKPINLFWQFNLNINAEYGFNGLIDDLNHELFSSKDLFNAQISSAALYYPDTRSIFSLKASARYGNKFSNSFQSYNPNYNIYYLYDLFNFYTLSQFPIDGLNNVTPYNYWTSSLEFAYYYYINPKTRLQTILSLYYSDQDFVILNTDKLRTSFGVSFSYALF